MVVGRITAVGAKRWTVDVGAAQDAVLQLSAVNLPGGTQRRRTYDDQLAMRSLLAERDLVSAEVQAVNRDGSLALHTRSLKYGRLECGALVRVPPPLVKRLKAHFHALPCGVDAILGNNGFVWLAPAGGPPVALDARRRVARVRNAVVALRAAGATISPGSVMAEFARRR